MGTHWVKISWAWPVRIFREVPWALRITLRNHSMWEPLGTHEHPRRILTMIYMGKDMGPEGLPHAPTCRNVSAASSVTRVGTKTLSQLYLTQPLNFNRNPTRTVTHGRTMLSLAMRNPWVRAIEPLEALGKDMGAQNGSPSVGKDVWVPMGADGQEYGGHGTYGYPWACRCFPMGHGFPWEPMGTHWYVVNWVMKRRLRCTVV